MIPKQIFQTYSDYSLLSSEVKESIDSMRAMNPDYEYFFFNDSDQEQFISEHYPEKLALWSQIRAQYGASRADYFRYLLIQKHGGIYLDIKSGSRKKFSEFIREDDKFLLSYWNQDVFPLVGNHKKHGVEREFQNWHIISIAQNPYLAKVIDTVENRINSYSPFRDKVGQQAVLAITGPIAYSIGIEGTSNEFEYRLFDSHASGLIYNVVRSGTHHELFKKHYSQLRVPLVYKNRSHDFVIGFFFDILHFVKVFVKKLMNIPNLFLRLVNKWEG